MFDFDDDDYITIGLAGWTEECGRAAESLGCSEDSRPPRKGNKQLNKKPSLVFGSAALI